MTNSALLNQNKVFYHTVSNRTYNCFTIYGWNDEITKVDATSLKLEIRVHAHWVGMNT